MKVAVCQNSFFIQLAWQRYKEVYNFLLIGDLYTSGHILLDRPVKCQFYLFDEAKKSFKNKKPLGTALIEEYQGVLTFLPTITEQY